MNYYRRYIGDYQRDTMHLSLMEHGAYAMLLDSFYAQDGNLPETHSVLFRLCRATSDEEKHAVVKVAEEFFPVTGGRRLNNRGLRELDIAIARIECAKENGKKGGRPRKVVVQESKEETGRDSGGITRDEPAVKAIQPPTSIHQPPPANHQPPSSGDQGEAEDQEQQRSAGVKHSPAAAAAVGRGEGIVAKIWRSYAEAYAARYGVAPIRNAKVNGQLTHFARRMPGDEAPQVAAFYVRSNRGLYAGSKHCIDLLLRDAERHRTEWATGHAGTDTEARMNDRTAATGNVFGRLIAEARAREAEFTLQEQDHAGD